MVHGENIDPNASAFEQVTRNKLIHVESDITEIKNSVQLMWRELKELNNRLPVWATMMFTVMGLILGVCFTALWKS